MTADKKKTNSNNNWFYELVLIAILLIGAYFRFVGLNWDENQHLHPDERFLTMVETGITPVEGIEEYFNTQVSSLNPHNVGFGFYVYGTLPLFIVRYVGEWMQQVSYNEFSLVGRQLSALANLMVVFLVYLIAARIYDKRVGLLTAAFSAFTVLEIQLAHFFTVDTFTNLFLFLAIYFAARISTTPNKPDEDVDPEDKLPYLLQIFPWSDFFLFGIALGLAAASKIDSSVVAVLLPVAVLIKISSLPQKDDGIYYIFAMGNLVLAAVVSLLTFRLFQPYAFSGPSFFGVGLNDLWVGNIRSLIDQAAGDIDWPPSIQWARRPVWFSFQNMVLWGLGLPMAIAAWGGVLWAGWRIATGRWRNHMLLWSWTVVYFLWQSIKFNPTMRYQIAIYPTLAIFAGWAVVSLWDAASDRIGFGGLLAKVSRPAALFVGVGAVAGTFLWALAFSNTYSQPIPRVSASRWIYQNIPGPITLPIESEGEVVNQPLPFAYNQLIRPDKNYFISFTAAADGVVSKINLKHVLAPVDIRIFNAQNLSEPILSENRVIDLSVIQGNLPATEVFELTFALIHQADVDFILRFNIPPGKGSFRLDNINLNYTQTNDQTNHELPLLPGTSEILQAGGEFQATYSLPQDGQLKAINLHYSVLEPIDPAAQEISLRFGSTPDMDQIIAAGTSLVDVSTNSRGLNAGAVISLDRPIELKEGSVYYLDVEVSEESNPLTLLGTAAAIESSWDDGLPVGLDGYNGYGGIYQQAINFEMYWDDDNHKLNRFQDTLDKSEYIFISSSRQWASTPRIPERYPLTTVYYRSLLGCPADKSIEWCYNVAEPEMFKGTLGFELVEVFQTDPTIGNLRINDQFSEEAFTVYDHPKVFIFRKSAEYDAENVSTILGAVDLSKVMRLTPKQASAQRVTTTDLMLPLERFAAMQASGTWAELFDINSLINRSQPLGVVYWYIAVTVLGLAAYPLVRLALPGLQDRGYPFSRVVGLLLLSYFSWLAGSVGLQFSRLTIGVVFTLLLLIGGIAAYLQREELLLELREKGSYFFKVEALFIAFFLFDLMVRYGNPDLWHQYKGGEKPMDFSYFNAVLKSNSFPPYDPWFSGGYINYYYFGFVYVGSLVKMLGIVPAFAYNLFLPTIFSFIAMGAFSIGWNFVQHMQSRNNDNGSSRKVSPWLIGIAAALLMAVLGNLGSLRMIFQGYQQLGSAGLYFNDAGVLTRWTWAIRGVFESLKGVAMPYGIGDWYWNPSRVSPDEAITEFPWFTVLYADPHAHLFALGLTLLVIAWVLSMNFKLSWQDESRKPKLLQIVWGLTFGALVIGVLYPMNTWDFPTYMVFGSIGLAYAVWRNYDVEKLVSKTIVTPILLRVLLATGVVSWLIFMVWLLYRPYFQWYAPPVSTSRLWDGTTHTPSGAYFTHWGLFLFVIVSWIIWETRQWFANTPLSSLRKVQPYFGLIGISFIVLVATVIYLHTQLSVYIAWFVLPLAVWVTVLLFRIGQSDIKRLIMFMIGTGLFLTLIVEIYVIDGRMNTVFKFYLQTWTLFVVCSAAALGWLLSEIGEWRPTWRKVWQAGLIGLAVGAALFPIFGTLAKMRDRMTIETPNTLDGMAYMQYANYVTAGLDSVPADMELDQDYDAIQWMQGHVLGSPTIVEAHNPEYRWGNRFTIYTGLPGVIGWQNHQRQQRGFIAGSQIVDRTIDVQEFYNTEDKTVALTFLKAYNIGYVVVGQLERAYYQAKGIGKFDLWEGDLWREVYSDRDTVIYETISLGGN